MSLNIINNLGFNYDEAFDVKGRLSISDLFPKSRKRCGIYLLQFADETYYIGQAIDSVRRFSQHRKNYNDIIQYWFMQVDKQKLNEVEEELIKLAEENGLLLRNKTFVSNIIGDTDLDLIINPDQQNHWLNDGKEIDGDGFRLYSQIDYKFKVKYQDNFRKLKEVELYPQIKNILKLYIEKFIPSFQKTEMSFWSLSCLPSTNKNTFPRYFCLNINSMEVFVLDYEKKSNQIFCFFNCTTSFCDTDHEIERLYKKFSTLEIQERNYRAAGSDQINFHLSDLTEVEHVFTTESKISDSIKELNLRLMRKGGTIYSPYHCFELANDVLNTL